MEPTKPPGDDEYCKFIIDGVKYKTVRRMQELIKRQLRRKDGKVRNKDAFYYLLSVLEMNEKQAKIMERINAKD